MLSVAVDVEGVIRKLNTAALSVEDLSEPLARFGGYLKARALKRYEAQDFTGLAASTLKHRAQKGLHQVEKKLERDLRKATGRATASQRSPRGLLGAILSVAPTGVTGIVGESRGMKNRRSVLQAFQRRYVQRVSKGRKAGGFERMMGAEKLSLKQHASLAGRVSRAITKAMDGPILGQWPRTLHVVVEGDRMMLVARTAGEWSEVHNEGGTGGHGAREPKRETVVLEERDLQVFIKILKESALAPFEET